MAVFTVQFLMALKLSSILWPHGHGSGHLSHDNSYISACYAKASLRPLTHT